MIVLLLPLWLNEGTDGLRVADTILAVLWNSYVSLGSLFYMGFHHPDFYCYAGKRPCVDTTVLAKGFFLPI